LLTICSVEPVRQASRLAALSLSKGNPSKRAERARRGRSLHVVFIYFAVFRWRVIYRGYR